MKSRVLMATLVVAMLMGVRTYAYDCGPCAEVGPCDSSCARSCDLFSGLKRLVAGNPCAPNDCGPCDAIVACTPCDDAYACDPCGACDSVGCNDGCGPKFAFGSRLRAFFAAKGSCNPCDPCGTYDNGCDPCAADNGCGPCDDVCGPCDDVCSPRSKFQFRNLFKGFGKLQGCNDGCGPCNANGCEPCDPCGPYNGCEPCDPCGPYNGCEPCAANNGCGPCDEVCGPCDDICGSGRNFGRLFDRPRQGLKKFFDGFRIAKCDVGACNPCDPCGPYNNGCDPCGIASNGPCDFACGSPCSSRNAFGNGEAAAPLLPDAAN